MHKDSKGLLVHKVLRGRKEESVHKALDLKGILVRRVIKDIRAFKVQLVLDLKDYKEL